MCKFLELKNLGKLVDLSDSLVMLLAVSVAYTAFAVNFTSVSGLLLPLAKE